MKILPVVVGLTAPRTQEVLDRQLMIYVTAFGYVRISNKNTFIEMSKGNCCGETCFASFDGWVLWWAVNISQRRYIMDSRLTRDCGLEVEWRLSGPRWVSEEEAGGIGWDRSRRTTQSGRDHGARDRRQDDGGDNAEDEECLEKAAVMVRRALCSSLLCWLLI